MMQIAVFIIFFMAIIGLSVALAISMPGSAAPSLLVLHNDFAPGAQEGDDFGSYEDWAEQYQGRVFAYVNDEAVPFSELVIYLTEHWIRDFKDNPGAIWRWDKARDATAYDLATTVTVRQAAQNMGYKPDYDTALKQVWEMEQHRKNGAKFVTKATQMAEYMNMSYDEYREHVLVPLLAWDNLCQQYVEDSATELADAATKTPVLSEKLATPDFATHRNELAEFSTIEIVDTDYIPTNIVLFPK